VRQRGEIDQREAPIGERDVDLAEQLDDIYDDHGDIGWNAPTGLISCQTDS